MLNFICGVPGSGKTLLLTHLAIQEMLAGINAYRVAKKEIAVLNSSGYNLDYPPQKHLVYADYDISLSRKRSSYAISGYELGKPNPYFYTRFLPVGSKIFLDEAQRYYDSRMSKYLRDDVYQFFQIHRHNDYNIFFACQRLGTIDANIRALGQHFIIIDKLDIKKDEFNSFSKITWYTTIFDSCDVAEAYMLNRDKKEYHKVGKKEKIVVNYDVSRCYDSKSCKPLFYAGLEIANYEYYHNAGYSLDLTSIAEYNQANAFVAPVGYWKNTEYDKKILQKIGVKNYED